MKSILRFSNNYESFVMRWWDDDHIALGALWVLSQRRYSSWCYRTQLRTSKIHGNWALWWTPPRQLEPEIKGAVWAVFPHPAFANSFFVEQDPTDPEEYYLDLVPSPYSSCCKQAPWNFYKEKDRVLKHLILEHSQKVEGRPQGYRTWSVRQSECPACL